MTGAPTPVGEAQLAELGLRLLPARPDKGHVHRCLVRAGRGRATDERVGAAGTGHIGRGVVAEEVIGGSA